MVVVVVEERYCWAVLLCGRDRVLSIVVGTSEIEFWGCMVGLVIRGVLRPWCWCRSKSPITHGAGIVAAVDTVRVASVSVEYMRARFGRVGSDKRWRAQQSVSEALPRGYRRCASRQTGSRGHHGTVIPCVQQARGIADKVKAVLAFFASRSKRPFEIAAARTSTYYLLVNEGLVLSPVMVQKRNVVWKACVALIRFAIGAHNCPWIDGSSFAFPYEGVGD